MSLVTGDKGLHFATSINNSGLQQGVVSAQGILRGFASNVSKMDVFAGLAMGGAYAFSSIATNAYNASKAYETSMKEIQTISEATQNDFDGMSESIMKVGLEVPQTADELAKAFYQIASAGYDGAEGLNLLDISAKAAIGGVTDVETAADGITTAMNAWKISADGAETITDQLFKTVKLGKTTFPELSNNLSQVASIAASADIPLNEILGAIATLTKQGVPTAQAFTQIKSAILSTNDVLGDGWSKTMTFQEGMKAMADEAGGSQTKLKEMTGRVEAMNGVLGLTGKNAQMAADDLKGVTDSAGAAEAAFDTMVASAENQSKLLAANIEAALKPLGDYILETYKDISVFLNKAFENGDIEKFAKLVGVAVTALIAYKATTALTSISVMDMKRALVSARKAMRALNLVSKMNPFGLLIAGVTAAVTALVLFNNETDRTEESITAFNSELNKEQTELNNIFEALKNTTKGTTERKDLIDKINTQYKDYLPNLLEEGSSLEDIETAQIGANEALEKNIALKHKREAVDKAVGDYVAKRTEQTAKIIALATRKNKHLTAQAAKDFNELVDSSIQLGRIDTKLLKIYGKKYNTQKLLGTSTSQLIAATNKIITAYKSKNKALENINATYSGYADKVKKNITSYREEQMAVVGLYRKKSITYEEYLKKIEKLQKKYNLDKNGLPIKKKTTPITPKTPTTPTKPKEEVKILNYYDTLKSALADAKSTLMNLSDVQKNANVHLIEQQKNIIKNIEGQISEQEILLGLKEVEEVQQKEVTKSLNYYEKLKQNLIKEEQNLLNLSGQSDAIDQTAITAQNQLIEGVKLQIKEQEKLLGINQEKIIPEKIKLHELSIKELFQKRKIINTELEGIDELSDKYKSLNKEKENINENIAKSLNSWVSEGLNGMSAIGDSISEVNKEVGQLISMIANVGQDIGSVVTGLITGGPLGTIQAIVSGISLITDILSGARQKAQQEKATTDEIEKQNKKLEKQLDILAEARGVNRLKEYSKALSDIDNQLAEINKKEKETKKNIIGVDVINLKGEKQAKYDKEKLDEQAAALEQQKEDLINELNERVTGTTSNAITDSILQGFANGKFAAEDFADTFEDLMKNAMLESFKTKFLEAQFDKFYESFSEASESGGELTPSEMEELQKQFNSNIAEAQAGFEAMDSLFEGMFGSGIAGDDQEEAQKQGIVGEIRANLTEETGTVLAGTMNSIRVFVATQNEILTDMNGHLVVISNNTEYNKELEKLGNIETLLQQQNESLRSGGM